MKNKTPKLGESRRLMGNKSINVSGLPKHCKIYWKFKLYVEISKLAMSLMLSSEVCDLTI